MASQCRSVAVLHSSTPRLFIPNCSSASSSSRCNLRPSTYLRGQRLQSQRLPQCPISSTSRPLVQCVSSTFGGNGDDGQQNVVNSSILDKAPEPVRAFPWAKAGILMLKRLREQFLGVGKWLAIAALAVTVIGELSYTLFEERVLLIPVGMVLGIVFAGIMNETGLELSPGIKDEQTPWHLFALGSLFVALKLIAPYLPVWGRVSVPHFANGGLWQVIALVNDWRRKHADRKQ